MLTDTLKSLYQRDLERLIFQLNQYSEEKNLWVLVAGINNPAGNLCLHLVGNLNMFIGKILGNTDYVRKRDQEFALRGVPRKDLIQMIVDTQKVLDKTLSNLTSDELQKEYPLKVFKEKMTVEYFLVHLSSHLTFHLGQIDYHRRILDK